MEDVRFVVWGLNPDGREVELFRWTRNVIPGLERAYREGMGRGYTDYWATPVRNERPGRVDRYYWFDHGNHISYERERELEERHPDCIAVGEWRDSSGWFRAHVVEIPV